MGNQMYIITFKNVSFADANRYAEELRNALLDANDDIEVQRRRDNSHTQDIGSTLVIVLGTPAAVGVVNAISDWLKLRHNASLTIESDDKRIHVENISSKNAAELTKILLEK
jgi:hypothetical protein